MSDKIKVRKTRLTDFPDIYRILMACKIAKDSYLTRPRFAKMLRRNPGLFFVATCSGKVVGTICATHDGGYIGYVYKVGVDPAYHRRGIGKAMLTRVIVALERAKIYRVFAWIQPGNNASIGMFAKFGIDLAPGSNYSRKL